MKIHSYVGVDENVEDENDEEENDEENAEPGVESKGTKRSVKRTVSEDEISPEEIQVKLESKQSVSIHYYFQFEIYNFSITILLGFRSSKIIKFN